MKAGLSILVAMFLAAASGRAPEGIHRLADGSLLEGTAHRRGPEVVLETPFGTRSIPAQAYEGLAPDSLEDLRRRYKELADGSRTRAVQEQRALARWCKDRGLLSGLRRQLNILLALDVDEPWARSLLEDIAGTYAVHPLDGSPEDRDQRHFVEFLFQELAAADNTGAVLATEKAADLPQKLSLRPAMRALKRGNVRARWAAARVLASHLDSPPRISLLYRTSLQDGSFVVRREAVRALAATKDTKFAEMYAHQLAGPEAVVRIRAARALGELGMEEGVRPLVAAMARADGGPWPVHNNISVTRQMAYVKDYDVEVAQTAFIADPVVDVIQDGAVLDAGVIDIEFQKQVYAGALRQITGRDLGPDVRAWMRFLQKQEDG